MCDSAPTGDQPAGAEPYDHIGVRTGEGGVPDAFVPLGTAAARQPLL
ncbi:hypothetical protein AB0H86_17910 [Streptomyces sp. NPDC050997]